MTQEQKLQEAAFHEAALKHHAQCFPDSQNPFPEDTQTYDSYFQGALFGAQWQAQQGWISVEDELPEVGQSVLLIEDGDVLLSTFKYWPARHHGNTEAYFRSNSGSYSIAVYEVSHWQPLPSPPQNK